MCDMFNANKSGGEAGSFSVEHNKKDLWMTTDDEATDKKEDAQSRGRLSGVAVKPRQADTFSPNVAR